MKASVLGRAKCFAIDDDEKFMFPKESCGFRINKKSVYWYDFGGDESFCYAPYGAAS